MFSKLFSVQAFILRLPIISPFCYLFYSIILYITWTNMGLIERERFNFCTSLTILSERRSCLIILTRTLLMCKMHENKSLVSFLKFSYLWYNFYNLCIIRNLCLLFLLARCVFNSFLMLLILSSAWHNVYESELWTWLRFSLVRVIPITEKELVPHLSTTR